MSSSKASIGGQALAEVVGKAEEMAKERVVPAAKAGLALAEDKISRVDIAKSVANTLALCKAAMVDSASALTITKDHKPRVDGPAGIADASETPRHGMSVIGPAAANAGKWASEHPGLAVCAAAGIAIVAAPGLVTAPLLGAAGFGQGGVIGGSIAAGIQSGIGNVAAGSVFAFFQGAGAGGTTLAAVNGVVQGAGLAAAGAAAARAVRSKGGDVGKHEDTCPRDCTESGAKSVETTEAKV